jgi:hypothetical protein
LKAGQWGAPPSGTDSWPGLESLAKALKKEKADLSENRLMIRLFEY